MKICGFAQLRNELYKGNLHNWFKSMEFCDFIYIFDQASDDGSQEVYKQHDNVTVIQSETNRFNEEITCKKELLEKLLHDHPDVDWIFWMDGDTCLDKRLAERDFLIEFLNEHKDSDGISIHHLNLWRSNCYARLDNKYNELHPICFWRNNGQLHFPEQVGLHARTVPLGVNKVTSDLEYNLIHYGFSTDSSIIDKYNSYKSFGQSGWALERLVSEATLSVTRVPDACLPDFIDKNIGCLLDGSYDNTRKSIREIMKGGGRKRWLNNAEIWDQRHLNVGSAVNYVTDLDITELRKWHKLPLFTNQKVLEIGIGYGKTVRQLKADKNTVYACDISELAISRVKDDCDGVFLTENLSDIEPVDLAICHLTLQHNTEHEVHRIIDQVNLKEDGVASFQFASLHPTKSVLSELIVNDLNKSMLYFYSPQKFTSIVDATNKEVVEFIGPYWFDSPFSFEWYICRIKNKDRNDENNNNNSA